MTEKHHHRQTLSLLLFTVALGLLALGCEEEIVLPQNTATVERAPLTFSASYYGELKAKQSIAIHAPQLSRSRFFTVETVVEDGTEVKEGDVVLTFERGPLEDELRERKAELAVADAELRRTEQALSKERIDLQLEVKRREMAVNRSKLYVVEGVNLVSRLELDKAKLDVQRSTLELDLARKAFRAFAQKRKASLDVQNLKAESIREKITEIEDQLGHMDVKAPASGVLYGPYTRLNWTRGKVAPGRVVRPGDKMLEIPDLSSYIAHLYVRQRDATLVEIGDEATVYITAIPDRPITGKVSKKESFATTRNERLGSSTPEGNLKEVLVVIELDEAFPEMRPGGTVRADISSILNEETLILPLAAINDTKDGKNTVTLEGGSAQPIKLGQSSTTFVEVVEGVEEGDVVIFE